MLPAMWRHVGWLCLGCLMACGSDSRRGSTDSGNAIDAPGTDSTVAMDVSSADVTTSGGREIGDPCTDDSECTNPPDAVCFTRIENPFNGQVIASYPGGFCSKGCENTADCGTGDNVTCVSQSSSGGGGGSSSMTCTISCESDAECRQSEGYRCQMLLGFGFCTP